MTIQPYALIDSTGNVVNVVLADATFVPPSGETMQLIGTSGAGISWKFANGTFVAPSAPTPPLPTLAEVAADAIAAGLPVNSASLGNVGNFPLTQGTQLRFGNLLDYYSKFGSFPNKAITITLKDLSGAQYTLSSAQFEALYQTLGDYLTLLEDCIAGIVTSLPDPASFGSIP